MYKGFFESIIDETLQSAYRATNTGDRLFNTTLFHRNFLQDDIRDFFYDYGAKISNRVALVSNNTTNEHRWLYRVSTSLNVLIGSDPRDTEVDLTELEPLPIEPEEDHNHESEN